jgi:hypothetical protein
MDRQTSPQRGMNQLPGGKNCALTASVGTGKTRSGWTNCNSRNEKRNKR